MASGPFRLDVSSFENLQKAMKDYQGDTEKAINEILHNEASPLIKESIRRLMPASGHSWNGKKPAAKTSKRSLTDLKENLAITVRTSKNYQYLYFPDDGTNTRRHAGNKQFFRKGGELKQDEIVDRCINRLVNDFENL